ncbi:16S rRNA (adenine(1518)-N(6)/adenine(1519)-N(6))-dimethyltransferase RsmA [Flavobacteriaceae bacterium]|nr:16S rRNA (adenine(1518)-N(6)/adenine(1519)-N(6))-dimethyltransferase RsmA [Flavobacteriaceae bacterium]
MSVRAKKHLGQHFLKDETVAERIADSFSYEGYDDVLEIGPGMGVLTKYLLKKPTTTHVVEIDSESVAYLHAHYMNLSQRIYEEDFLKSNLKELMGNKSFAIAGNFPYNISTQIVFKTIENREFIPEFGGMFQKEVAERIAHGPGSKKYGITSVLTQAFYDVEYLFTVPPHVFDPPPKVDSGVIFMKRKEKLNLEVDEKLFFRIVKMSFNTRRKTLRNSLKSFGLEKDITNNVIFDLRPEQLSVEEFISLTRLIQDQL